MLNTVKPTSLFLLILLGLAPRVTFQNNEPVIKAETLSAFVWGQDSPSGAVSSTIEDPLTGNEIHKLSYGEIEVSSKMGFENVPTGEVGTFLIFRTTIVNNTHARVSVRYGGISVDGHEADPLLFVLPTEKLTRKEHKGKPGTLELGKLHCFANRFLASDDVLSMDRSSQAQGVAPQGALTLSSVVRDPRNYSPLRCSVDGCYPTGTMRYYLHVGAHDYVFTWLGRSAVYCGN